MNYINKVYLLVIVLCALLHHSNGYSASVLDSVSERDSVSSFVFQFRFQNSVAIYDYKNNAAEFDRLRDMIIKNHAIEIEKIDITGFASPDGYDAINIPLANERALAIRSYLYWKYPHLKQVQINITSRIGDWARVIEDVEKDPIVPNRSKVLAILKSKFDSPTKTANLIALPEGSYSYVLTNILSQQREVVTCMFHYKAVEPTVGQNPQAEVKDTVAVVIPETVVEPVAPVTEVVVSEPVRGNSKVMLAIKTDLVQWAGLTSDFDGLHAVTPNLALELFFAKRWSVEAGYSYSNWNAFTQDTELWAVSRGWVEPRFWLRNNKFSGFYLGLYGQLGSYDTQGLMAGHTGTFYDAGLSLGYLQPLSKHWFLELGIRGGYRSTDGVLYDIEPENHYYYNKAENTSKFAPQVRFNLVYRIGHAL